MHAGVTIVEMNVAALDRQLAAIGHRVARVERKVEQRGGELVGIDHRGPGVLGEHRRDLDMLAERRPQQLGGVEDQRVDVDLDRLQRLLTGEGQ